MLVNGKGGKMNIKYFYLSEKQWQYFLGNCSPANVPSSLVFDYAQTDTRLSTYIGFKEQSLMPLAK